MMMKKNCANSSLWEIVSQKATSFLRRGNFPKEDINRLIVSRLLSCMQERENNNVRASEVVFNYSYKNNFPHFSENYNRNINHN
jgi:hypothetical protein